jgi:DNA-3-methyladenine glycosylase II
MVYARELAAAILSKKINLKSFEKKEDDVVRKELTALKGIGNWTADIYLLHALQRTDILPLGDLALVNAVQMVTNQKLEKAEIEAKAVVWRPYRSIATMIFWHYYLKKRKIVLVH